MDDVRERRHALLELHPGQVVNCRRWPVSRCVLRSDRRVWRLRREMYGDVVDESVKQTCDLHGWVEDPDYHTDLSVDCAAFRLYGERSTLTSGITATQRLPNCPTTRFTEDYRSSGSAPRLSAARNRDQLSKSKSSVPAPHSASVTDFSNHLACAVSPTRTTCVRDSNTGGVNVRPTMRRA